MITYYIRVACHWIKVTTSVTRWASLPRVVASLGCKAAPFVIAGLMHGATPVLPLPGSAGGSGTSGSYPGQLPSGAEGAGASPASYLPTGGGTGGEIGSVPIDGSYLPIGGGGGRGYFPPATTTQQPDADNPVTISSPVFEAPGQTFPGAPCCSQPPSNNYPVISPPDSPPGSPTSPPRDVPEPTSLILLGEAVLAALCGRWVSRLI